MRVFLSAWCGVLVALMLSVSVPACLHAPPNISPQAKAAFYGTQVIKDLDRVRDAAIAANMMLDTSKTPPVPLLSEATTRVIVNWHTSAITVVHDAPAGWKATVLSSLQQVKANLSPTERALIGQYLDLAAVTLQELP